MAQVILAKCDRKNWVGRMARAIAYPCLLSAVMPVSFIAAEPDPPPPHLPGRWKLAAALSDEFNGTELDSSKWRPAHPWFLGKAPGVFRAKNVHVEQGILNLKVTTLKQRFRSRWMGSPVVSSLHPTAAKGYYEARIRAAPASLNSAWFLQIKTGQEIDIAENYGGSVKNPNLTFEARSNTHWHPPGWERPRNTHLIHKIATPNTEWHVYAAWFKSSHEVEIFVDSRSVGSHDLGGDFKNPMYMIFDVEPSPSQGIPLPGDITADPRKHTMQVDWVRTWVRP